MTFQLTFTVEVPEPDSDGISNILFGAAAVGMFGFAGLRVFGRPTPEDPGEILLAAACRSASRLGSIMSSEGLEAWKGVIPVRTGLMRASAISGHWEECELGYAHVTATTTVWFGFEGDQYDAWIGLMRYRPDLIDWPVRYLGAEASGARQALGSVRVHWASGLSGR